MTGRDGGVAEGDEQVAPAGAGGADEAEVLGGADPLERGQIVVGAPRHRALRERELLDPLLHGEGSGTQAALGIGV